MQRTLAAAIAVATSLAGLAAAPTVAGAWSSDYQSRAWAVGAIGVAYSPSASRGAEKNVHCRQMTATSANCTAIFTLSPACRYTGSVALYAFSGSRADYRIRYGRQAGGACGKFATRRGTVRVDDLRRLDIALSEPKAAERKP